MACTADMYCTGIRQGRVFHFFSSGMFRLSVLGSIIYVFAHFYFSVSGQAVWSGASSYCPPRVLPSTFIARSIQQSDCSSIFHRLWLIHSLALSPSQFMHKKKSSRIFTSACTWGG